MAEKDPKEGDEAAIFKVATVPPPAGDDDAYSAPTKVGPHSLGELEQLILEADAEGRRSVEALQQAPESARPMSKRRPTEDGDHPPASAPVSSKRPAEISAPPPARPLGPPGEVPRLYDEEGEDREESNAATLLHPLAKGLRDTAARADADAILGTSGPETEADVGSGPVRSPLEVQRSPFGARAVAIGVCIVVLVGLAMYLAR